MSNNSNQDDQTQCGSIALCQPGENKEGAVDMSSPRGVVPRRRPAQPMHDQVVKHRVTQEQGRSNYAQSPGSVEEISPEASALKKSHQLQLSTTAPSPTSIPDMARSAAKLPPPIKALFSPVKRRNTMPESGQGRKGSMHSNQRTRLLVFIKIILKCLDFEDPSLHLEVKQIVTECTRKNREGIPGYDPLTDAITRQLRIAVGEVHWNRAENLMTHYMQTRTRPMINTMKMDKPKQYYAAV